MKQIVLYLITYACVTTTVAGVVQIEIHKNREEEILPQVLLYVQRLRYQMMVMMIL